MSRERYLSFYGAGSQNKKTWKCPKCVSKQPKSNNVNTPVRLTPPKDEKTDVCRCDNSSSDDQHNITQRRKVALAREGTSPREASDEECASEIKLHLEEMRALRMELSSFRDIISDLTSTIKAQNVRLDNLESRIDTLEMNMSNPKTEEFVVLEEMVGQLKSQIQEREQELLMNDVEIWNYPETTNENTTHILLTVANKLGVDLEERDIVVTRRAGRVRALVEGAINK